LKAKWQTLRNIAPHSFYECLSVVPAEDLAPEGRQSESLCGAVSMHTIQDCQRLGPHQERRPVVRGLRQRRDPRLVHSAARRQSDPKVSDKHLNDRETSPSLPWLD
jgi:hypothetical protein